MKKLLLLFAIFAMFTSCKKEEVEEPTFGEVKYEVECYPASFYWTYTEGTITATQNGWETAEYTFIGNQGDRVYLSAVGKKEKQTITCRIFYKGVLIKEDTQYERKVTISTILP